LQRKKRGCSLWLGIPVVAGEVYALEVNSGDVLAFLG
jgi:hypothetical protein